MFNRVGESQAEEAQYPSEVKFADGKKIIAIICESESKQTRFGMGLLLHIVTPDSNGQFRCMWWPKGAGTPPPIHQPFMVRRIEKGVYDMFLPDDDDQAKALWTKGEIPKKDAAKMMALETSDAPKVVPKRVNDILTKFK